MSLVVALVMSMAAWRLTRDEKQRSAARVAALSVARPPLTESRHSRRSANVGAFAPERRAEAGAESAVVARAVDSAPVAGATRPPLRIAQRRLRKPRASFRRRNCR